MADPADVMFHDPAVVPGTHALVLGLGEYPHLIGGAEPATAQDGLRQLSSPPMSARAFATWMLHEYRCPGRELASLSLLTSEPDPAPFTGRDGVDRPVPAAGIDAIVAAISAWKKRGDTSPDNRLVFYFCGHGISEGNDMALLAREFSLDEDNPLDKAIDFRQLGNGLRKCAAEQQVFLVDACRASSDVLISQTGGTFAGRVPLLGGGLPRRGAITYYATLAGDLAYARTGEVSLFTEAVLRALRGAGSDDPDGDWWVSTSRLHEAVDHFLKQPVFAGKIAGIQVPAVNAMPIFPVHRLDAPPEVPVYVTCGGADDNAKATFVCRQNGAETFHRDAGDVDEADPDGRWILDLPAGSYDFEARLGPDDVRAASATARPVFREITLRTTP